MYMFTLVASFCCGAWTKDLRSPIGGACLQSRKSPKGEIIAYLFMISAASCDFMIKCTIRSPILIISSC